MNAWSWAVVGLLPLLVASAAGWGGADDLPTDAWDRGAGAMVGMMGDAHWGHMRCTHDDRQRAHGGGEVAWAPHTMWGVGEARNYTGLVTSADPLRNLVRVQLEDGREVTFKLLRVYLDPRTGYLVLGSWIAASLGEGSEATVTGLGSEGFKLALAVYAGDLQYLAPRYYAAQQAG